MPSSLKTSKFAVITKVGGTPLKSSAIKGDALDWVKASSTTGGSVVFCCGSHEMPGVDFFRNPIYFVPRRCCE